jgi:20S proteasome alpha/beta subunit
MVKAILFIGLFLFFCCDCYNQIHSHGSYWIGAICKDGIVIGADTRQHITYPNNPDSTLAYYDTVQKVFAINNFLIATEGDATIGGRYVYYYLNEFKNSQYGDCNILNCIQKLDTFFKSTYPLVENQFLTLKINVVGYIKNTPFLCVYAKNDIKCIKDSSFACVTSKCNMAKRYSFKYDCKEMGDIIEKEIRLFANKYGLSKEIGGPIMVLKITPDNQFHWVKNKPTTTPWEYATDFYTAYRNKKLRIRFTSKSAKLYIDSLVGRNVPMH